MLKYLGNRRSAALGAAGMMCLIVAATACGSSDTKASTTSAPSGTATGGLTTLTYPLFSTGMGVIIGQYIVDHHIDNRFGLKLDLKKYNSLQTYYADSATGRLDISYGSPSDYVSQVLAGAKLHLVSTLGPMSGALYAKDDSGITSPNDLKGKRIGAITAAGTWKIMIATLDKYHGLDLKTQANIVTVSNSGQAAAQLSAGTLDVGMGWEPAVSGALAAVPNTKVVYNLRQDYTQHTGKQMWQFVFEVHNGALSAALQKKFLAMMTYAARQIDADPAAADAVGVQIGLPKGVVGQAISSKRLSYVVNPMTPQVVSAIKAQVALLHSTGAIETLPPESFYGG